MKKVKILFVFLTLFFCLSGCKSNDDEELNNKVKEEFNYADNKILSMINNLNNISLDNYTITFNKAKLNEKDTNSSEEKQGEKNQSGGEGGQEQGQEKEIETTEMKNQTILGNNEDEIKWDLIRNEIETLNNSWSIMLLDLYTLNCDKSEILAFSDKLNETIVSINEENKIDTLRNLRDLYSYIPKFMNSTNLDYANQKIRQAKFYLINAYVSVNENNWDNVKVELAKCENEFNELANDGEYIENKEYKVSKIYILIREIENSSNIEDNKVFYIKYKNLLQSMNSI